MIFPDLPDFKRAQTVIHPNIVDAAYTVVEDLENAGIRYMFIGALAVDSYVRPRTTKDVDVSVLPEAYVIENNVGKFRPEVPFRVGSVKVDPVTAFTLDAPEEMVEDAYNRSHKTAGVVVAPVDFLMFSKLISFRPRDRDDIGSFIEAGLDVWELRNYITKWGFKDLIRRLQKIEEDYKQ